jgi:tripartite-type tricarboxylate transporter receptor subunit TctC
VVTVLNRELNAVLNDPQVRETLIKNGLEPMPDTPQAFKAFLDAEYDKWGKTIRGAAIRAE